MTSAAPASPRPSWVKRALMYAFATACLAWVFHDIHPRRLLDSMVIANWWFVVAAVAVDISTYVLQGVRWKLLLSPVGRIGPLRATQAIYAGLFTNEVVPLRFGELVRGFLAAQWLSAGITSVVPSMVVERFLDALCLAAGIGLAALFVALPRDLLDAADVLGAVVLAAAALLAWIVFRKERDLEAGRAETARATGLAASLSRFVVQVAAGLRQIGISGRFYLAALLSAAMLMSQALAVWFMLLACGFHLALGAGIVVFLVVRIGTAIPNAPANVGSFQFFTVLALGLFAIDKTRAAAFSIIDFAALTAPLWILGLLAVSRTGMRWSDLRAKVLSLRSTQLPLSS